MIVRIETLIKKKKKNHAVRGVSFFWSVPIYNACLSSTSQSIHGYCKDSHCEMKRLAKKLKPWFN